MILCISLLGVRALMPNFYMQSTKDTIVCDNVLKLSRDMTRAWEENAIWTRMLMISTLGNLPDEQAVYTRLMRNSLDMGNVFRTYFGNVPAQNITNLFARQIEIISRFIHAVKIGNNASAELISREWNWNAFAIAGYLSSINSFYSRNVLQTRLYEYVRLTINQIAMRKSEDYWGDIMVFDLVENQALRVSDYLVDGIKKKFPDRFSA